LALPPAGGDSWAVARVRLPSAVKTANVIVHAFWVMADSLPYFVEIDKHYHHHGFIKGCHKNHE
jgi:hypothetical protein